MKKVYLVAVVVALVAGICTFLFANQLFKTVSAKSADTTKVWVPTQNIDPNTKLSLDVLTNEFEEKDIFTKDLIENVVLSKEDLVDKINRETLYAHEQININRFYDSNAENLALSLKLSADEQAYTIKASERQGVDGYISVGDTVDLLYIPRDVEDLRDYINGTGKYADQENGDSKPKSDTDKSGDNSTQKDGTKRDKDGKLLYGPNQDMTLDDIYSLYDVEVFSDLEVLAISNHDASSASEQSGGEVTNYSNITLRLRKEDVKEIKKLQVMFGEDSYTLALNKKANN
ncbi:hypothetical protein [Eubacterium sp.]|uniref:hypothetical protein n=1 Tax=Eubacterium sp. TaxID=142586 RepID=UPI0025D96CDD|nr:hypothetical protein [Eubacterium sp.]MCR5629259.1 hypothetical protein [Eubacterium sp.]